MPQRAPTRISVQPHACPCFTASWLCNPHVRQSSLMCDSIYNRIHDCESMCNCMHDRTTTTLWKSMTVYTCLCLQINTWLNTAMKIVSSLWRVQTYRPKSEWLSALNRQTTWDQESLKRRNSEEKATAQSFLVSRQGLLPIYILNWVSTFKLKCTPWQTACNMHSLNQMWTYRVNATAHHITLHYLWTYPSLNLQCHNRHTHHKQHCMPANPKTASPFRPQQNYNQQNNNGKESARKEAEKRKSRKIWMRIHKTTGLGNYPYHQ